MQDTSEITGGVGDTVVRLGDAISQQELPLLGNTVTNGAGEVVAHTGHAVNSLARGLHDGLGMFRTNDNALGVTVGGVTSAVSDVGRGVGAVGDTVTALGGLPVLVQIEVLSPRWRVSSRVDGFWSDDRLPSSEQGNYGAAKFGRGYGTSQGRGDRGIAGEIEVRRIQPTGLELADTD